MRSTLCIIGFAAALAACQTAPYSQDDSPYYVIPNGTRLTLNKAVTFPPDQTSVHIQNGRIMPMSRVQVYSPFCKFELLHRHDAAVTVAPDEITVTRAFRQQIEDRFSRNTPRTRLQVATIGLIAQMGGGNQGGAPQLLTLSMRMDLHSEKQPEIFRLTCARWAPIELGEHLTVADMRRTLNPLFTLHLPGEN